MSFECHSHPQKDYPFLLFKIVVHHFVANRRRSQQFFFPANPGIMTLPIIAWCTFSHLEGPISESHFTSVNACSVLYNLRKLFKKKYFCRRCLYFSFSTHMQCLLSHFIHNSTAMFP
jgi:hypothetical protein